ncbi:MAG: hypothetical protein ACYC5H_04790 [Methylovirgula sp.]
MVVEGATVCPFVMEVSNTIIVGAVLVGGTAWARMTLFVLLHVERRVAGGPASFPLAVAIKDG